MLKLKEVDERREQARKILLELMDNEYVDNIDIKVLADCLDDLRQLTDAFDYLGNESLKYAEKRKDRN